jgi:hypothetical protein
VIVSFIFIFGKNVFKKHVSLREFASCFLFLFLMFFGQRQSIMSFSVKENLENNKVPWKARPLPRLRLVGTG